MEMEIIQLSRDLIEKAGLTQSQIDEAIESSDGEAAIEWIKRGMNQMLGGTMTVAIGVSILDAKGIDIPSNLIPQRVLTMFRKIADGALLPEVYEKYLGQPDVLRKAMFYPIHEQKKLINGPVDVVVPGEKEAFTTRKMQIDQLPPRIKKMVLGPDHIRSDSEQIAWIEKERIENIPKRSGADASPVKVDKKRKGVYVKADTFIERSDLIRYYEQLTA